MILVVYEFAELADPVTETGFDGRLGAAGELGDPGESQESEVFRRITSACSSGRVASSPAIRSYSSRSS